MGNAYKASERHIERYSSRTIDIGEDIGRSFTSCMLPFLVGESIAHQCPICSKPFFGQNAVMDLTRHADSCIPKTDSTNFSPPHIQQNNDMLRRVQEARDNFNSIRVSWSDSRIKLWISRTEFFMDSMTQLLSYNTEALRSEFKINFIGEIAQDAGGLTKEWLSLLIKEVLSDQFRLFKLANTDETCYTIVPNNFDPELYQLAGKVIGKALFDNIPINCPLSKLIFKHILEHPVDREDLQYFDRDLYNAMRYMLSSNIDGVFFETFAVVNTDGSANELQPNGQLIEVNEENKEFYVQLRVEYETRSSIEYQIKWIKEGIFSVFPQAMIAELTPEDLEFMLCGNPEIDVSEWRENTVYRGDFSDNHQVVRWFWEILSELSQQELRDLLTYVTGTSRVPIEGFRALKTTRGDPALFTLEPIPYQRGALPRAHTCFNRMDLPLYQSTHEIKQAIKVVITNHILGFGME